MKKKLENINSFTHSIIMTLLSVSLTNSYSKIFDKYQFKQKTYFTWFARTDSWFPHFNFVFRFMQRHKDFHMDLRLHSCSSFFKTCRDVFFKIISVDRYIEDCKW